MEINGYISNHTSDKHNFISFFQLVCVVRACVRARGVRYGLHADVS